MRNLVPRGDCFFFISLSLSLVDKEGQFIANIIYIWCEKSHSRLSCFVLVIM